MLIRKFPLSLHVKWDIGRSHRLASQCRATPSLLALSSRRAPFLNTPPPSPPWVCFFSFFLFCLFHAALPPSPSPPRLRPACTAPSALSFRPRLSVETFQRLPASPPTVSGLRRGGIYLAWATSATQGSRPSIIKSPRRASERRELLTRLNF